MLVLILALLLGQSSVGKPAESNPRTTETQTQKQGQSQTETCVNVGGNCSVGNPSTEAGQQAKSNDDFGILDMLYKIAGIAGVLGAWVLLGIVLYQTKITQKELRLTHRPKRIVRKIAIPALKSLNRKSPMNDWTQEMKGYYWLANVGGLTATVTSTLEGIWVANGLPMEIPGEGDNGRKMNIILKPGESQKINHPDTVIPAEDAMDLIEGKANAFVIVRIEYIDEAGIIRNTSACRRYDPTTEQFTRVDNPDYEYAD
jgi:hypothetical protein